MLRELNAVSKDERSPAEVRQKVRSHIELLEGDLIPLLNSRPEMERRYATNTTLSTPTDRALQTEII